MELRFTQDKLKSVARKLINEAAGKRIIAFHGMMGAGKTTCIHALCDELEVKNAFGSPTYAIINEYEGRTGTIYHIDLYRLENAEEALRAGVEDCLYSGDMCFVEWPEKAPELFPDNTLHVYLTVIDEVTRAIRINDN